MTNTHTIDAAGKKLGRVASEAAKIIMGKDLVSFARNTAPKVKVVIENASKIHVTEKKMTQKQYKRYSGYPGGLRFKSMTEVIAEKGYKEIFRKAVYGMLPTNKLRAIMIKNLEVKE